MMKKRIFLSILVMTLFSIKGITCHAQTEISASSTRTNSNIDISTVTTAGDYVTSKTDNTYTLKYKYKDYNSYDYARIDVQVSSGTIPAGVNITLSAPGSTNSKGKSTSSGTVTLPSSGSVLLLYNIYNINDTYTITSAVTMKVNVATYGSLRAGTYPLTVTYTISSYLYAI